MIYLNFLKKVVPTLLLALFITQAYSQEINLDKPLRAGKLMLFQHVQKENVYYYMVDKPMLAKKEDGSPEFSFLRYVENVAGTGSQGRTEGTGGGIVHAVVSLAVSEEDLEEARQELQRLKSAAVIDGPIVPKSGTFSLISSFVEADGGLSETVVGRGNAPLLDGQKAAVSIKLTKLGAEILWESLQMGAGDLSFSFQMTVNGFRSPKKAKITANFDRIANEIGFEASIKAPMIKGEIDLAFEKLRNSGAIKVESFDTDADMETLISAAYTRLTDMLFTQAEAQETPSPTAMIPAATGSIRSNDEKDEPDDSTEDEEKGEKEKEDKPKITAEIKFSLKRKRQQGNYVIDMSKWAKEDLPFRFDGNIGDLSKYADDPNVFRQVNLNDPLYVQREVFASLSGSASNFDKYINYVTVRLEKTHANGQISNDEVRITRDNFNDEANRFAMLYGWNGDDDRSKWMEFKYQAEWSFFGDLVVNEALVTTTSNTIALSPQYKQREVQVIASAPNLTAAAIRMITVDFTYTVGGKNFTKQVTINPLLAPTEPVFLGQTEMIMPNDTLEYQYRITWRIAGGGTVDSGLLTSSESILIVDELPSSN